MNNIYLIGFMGSGKSTVGKLVSKALKRSFIDIDYLVSQMFDMSINDIFQSHGEAIFREAEASILVGLSRRKNLVVATGGGVYERSENREFIKRSGISIFLDASLETIKKRLGENEIGQRPLWKDFAHAERLFHSRRSTYEKCNRKIEVDGLTTGQISSMVCSFIYPDTEHVVDYEGYQSPVKVVWDAPGCIKNLTHGRKIAVLTDHNFERLHLDRYLDILGATSVISVKPGEKSKTLKVANHVYEKLLESNIERGDILLAIGGGVITDLGGFVASTYKRGIDFVLVGSTMVACVDAAVGGKSAIDVGNVKNSVGLFTKPLLTVLDLFSLHTLKSNHIRDGLVEAYKTGLVANSNLCSYMRENIRLLNRGSVIELSEVVKVSAETKCKIVSKDFRERNLRKILNLGHTYGHAVESYNSYRISHGQAVAMGMLVAINISLQRGLMGTDEAKEAIDTIKMIYPTTLRLPSAEQSWQIMLNDKKNRDGKITFVLLTGKGNHDIVNDVTASELDMAIEKLGGKRND